jgi:ABC-type transporter Mla maintaining outer membrane lipid asymmetry permease subunit MlaE
METDNILASLGESVERLSAAASMLERAVIWLEQREPATAGAVEKMTAAVESHSELLHREQELLKKLETAERQITELRAQSTRTTARQTLPASTTQLLAKQGISTLESIQAGALDAALVGLSIEQRIAVKSQLLRAGLLTQ